MSKTKTELEVEISELKKQLSDRAKEEQYDTAAMEMRRVYDAYIRAGFTEEQAWQMLTIQINGVSQPKKTLF